MKSVKKRKTIKFNKDQKAYMQKSDELLDFELLVNGLMEMLIQASNYPVYQC